MSLSLVFCYAFVVVFIILWLYLTLYLAFIHNLYYKYDEAQEKFVQKTEEVPFVFRREPFPHIFWGGVSMAAVGLIILSLYHFEYK
jgi:hypothetical protein